MDYFGRAVEFKIAISICEFWDYFYDILMHLNELGVSGKDIFELNILIDLRLWQTMFNVCE